MKTALLIVSFGTTHLDTFRETIDKTENALKEAFPSLPFYRAFTSRIVRSRLKCKYDMQIDSVEESLARISADGYEQVLLQPTLLIPGAENDRLIASVQSAAEDLNIVMGKPLMCSESDMDELIRVLMEAYPVECDTALLFMGHGTAHGANLLYELLAQKMRQHSDSVMRVCTAEGSPSFEDTVQELFALPLRKVTLAPLLFVAGDHAKNDMSGDDPDSLCSMLKAAGFEVTPILQGLGQIEAVCQMYVERAKAAADRLI